MRDAHMLRMRLDRGPQEYKASWRQAQLRKDGHRRMGRDGKLHASHAAETHERRWLGMTADRWGQVL